jgi:hypothetical protein
MAKHRRSLVLLSLKLAKEADIFVDCMKKGN